jgi:hypothetical protein
MLNFRMKIPFYNIQEFIFVAIPPILKQFFPICKNLQMNSTEAAAKAILGMGPNKRQEDSIFALEKRMS